MSSGMYSEAASLTERRSAAFLLMGVGSLLATSAISAKAAPMFGWPPLALLQWSMLGATLISGTANRLWRSNGARSLTVIGYAGASGILYALPNALAFGAAQHVGAGFVSLCFAFPLVLTYGMALSLGLEKLGVVRLAGVVSGVIGAVLLASGGVTGEIEHPIWVLAALTAPVIIAVGNIYRSYFWPRGVSASHLSTGMMLFGFLTMVAINTMLGVHVVPQSWTREAVALLAGQVLIFAILYDLYFRLQNLAGPVYLSQIGSVAAVVGALLALIIFAEVPTTQQIAAALFVGAGIYLVNKRTL